MLVFSINHMVRMLCHDWEYTWLWMWSKYCWNDCYLTKIKFLRSYISNYDNLITSTCFSMECVCYVKLSFFKQFEMFKKLLLLIILMHFFISSLFLGEFLTNVDFHHFVSIFVTIKAKWKDREINLLGVSPYHIFNFFLIWYVSV